MLKIGVLVSGGGTNLQAIIDNIESNYIKNAKIVTVVSSKEGVYSIERCKKYNIPCEVIKRKDYPDSKKYNEAILKNLNKYNVEFVVLAGFMSIVSDKLIEIFKNKIINIHPSLIPSFCGKGFYGLTPHKKALEYGVKITGATVHFVEKDVDAGPVILQKHVYIMEDDTPETLQKKVMEEAEWKILPEAIKLFSENKISVNGRKVRIK